MSISWTKIRNDITAILRDENSKGTVFAISGGVDSIFLLDMINRSNVLQEFTRTNRVFLAHFNHLPGQIMDDRANEFVERECKRIGVSEFLQIGYGNPTMGKTSASFEAEARRARYRYFNSLFDAEDRRPCHIVTAHNLSDQIEGILMGLCRGVPINCTPMAYKTEFHLSSGNRVIIHRPLLGITKEKIIKHATLRGLTWDEDETNRDEKFERNFFRHAVVPLLLSKRNIYKSIPKSVATPRKIVIDQGTLFEDN